MIARPRRCRRGTTLVESAFVYPVVLLLVFGLIVGGAGVFRYQEVAHLAREGARYASTHGGKYQLEGGPQKTGVPAISDSAGLTSYLVPRSTLLDPNSLQVSVTWSEAGNVTPANYPSYADPTPVAGVPGQVVIRNNVSVTVSYTWLPELYLIGPITLTSTSTMPMSY